MNEIIKIFTEITDQREMEKLFNEILTDKERSDINLRWQLMKELSDGMSQRDIASKYRISLCKITRGAKILKNKRSICRKLINEKD
ncbi:MAG: hypothetical protein A2Y40_08555 [Candidatus Margulisbacteria bacterium GWF2_35_9]|nr:MAG: hypothetical protein A2Y40_08555 [Candidatus Margulisbacteria bacterium GWF2_35_9]